MSRKGRLLSFVVFISFLTSTFSVTQDRDGTPLQPSTKCKIDECAHSISDPVPNSPSSQTSMSDPTSFSDDQTDPDTPTAFIVDSIFSTSLETSWPTEPGLTYKVAAERSEAAIDCNNGEDATLPGGKFKFTETSDGTAFTPRTSYYLAVCAVNAGGGTSVPNIRSAVKTGPPPPTNVRALSTTTNEIFVEWDDDDAVTGDQGVKNYTVHYKATNGNTDENKNTTDRTKSIRITGLQPNTQYTISVVSNTGNTGRVKVSDPSEPISGITTRPPSPSNFQVDSIYSTSVVTSWTEVDGLTYKVVAVPSSVTIDNCDNGEEVTTPSFIFTNTSDGTSFTSRMKYDLAVCAINAEGGTSDPSKREGVETGPATPTNVTISSTTTNEIFVEWDDDDAATVHPVIQYTVYYKPIAGSTDDEQSIQTDAVNEDDSANRVKSITITGLQSNTEYTISVVSITSNRLKTSDRSLEVTGTTQKLPSPSNFQTGSIYSTSIAISWDEEGDLTYKVVAVPSDDRIDNCDNGEEVTASSFTFTKTSGGADLTARTGYNLAVCTFVSGGGTSDPSVLLGVETGPPPPANVRTSKTTANETFVEWDDGDAINKDPVIQYTVYYKPTDDTDEKEATTPDHTKSITITGLQSNIEYTISVVSVTNNTKKTSDKSLSTTETTKPEMPTSFSVVSIYSTSIATTWNDEPGLTYKVVAERTLEAINCSKGEDATSPDGKFTFTNTSDGTGFTARMSYYLAVCAVNAGGGASEPSIRSGIKTGPAPPTNVRISNTTINETFVEWDDYDVESGGQAVIQYTVYYKPTTGGTDENNVTTNDRNTSITITGLQSNTEYTISVVSITANEKKTSDPSSSVPAITVPKQVSPPTSSNVTSSSFVLEWKEADEGTVDKNYTVACDSNDDSETRGGDGIDATSLQINDLLSNAEYSCKVAAVNQGGSGLDSFGTSVITFPTQANAPHPDEVTSFSISLSWEAAMESNSIQRNYTVSWNPPSAENVFSKAVGPLLSEKIDNLTSNTEYEFSVTARNKAGNGMPSTAVNYATVPRQLQSPTSSGVTNSSVVLKWTIIDEGTLDKNYTVACKSTDDSETRGGEGIVANSSQIDELLSNAEYSCMVAAVNQGGSGLNSPGTDVLTFPGYIPPPTNISTSATTEIFLQWKDVDRGSVDKTYIVRWRSIDEVDRELEASSTSTTISGLTPSTSYNVSVLASNEAGNSSWSPEGIFLTVPSETKQTNLSFVPTDNTTMLEVEWLKSDGGKEVDGYLVQWMNSSTGAYVGSHNEQHLKGNLHYSYTIENLTPGETYDVSVQAYNSADSGNPQVEKFTIVPEIVEDLSSSPSSDATRYLKLTWSQPNGTGDDIHVSYSSTTTSGNSANSDFPFETIEGEIPVEPGNNYTISVTTFSNGVMSREDASTKLQLNSEPEQVEYNTTTSKDSLTVSWSHPAGYVEGYKLRILQSSVTIVDVTLGNQETSYVVSELKPKTEYNVFLESFITGINGQLSYTDAPAPDPVTTKPLDQNLAWIAGVVVGILAAVFIVLGVLYYHRRRNLKKHNDGISMPPRNTMAPITIAKPVTSRKVKLSEFDGHVTSMHADSNLKFANEYQELLSVGRDQSTEASSLPENKPKNRYKNILAYDKSRVPISNANEQGSDYINANYIPGNNKQREYIATQGPLSGTREHFWRLVWEQNSRIIVMVTQVIESGKPKCDHYWPVDESPIQMEGMKVTLTSEIVSPDWTIREFDLSNGLETRNIKQFHYTAWPDHGVPQTTRTLVRFVWKVRQAINEENRHKTGPTTVHCSAGVGRTGTFIGMDRLLQTLRSESSVDIYGIVYEMRMHRMYMVQTESQYILLHQMVQDIANKAYDAYDEVDPIYANATAMEPVYENAAFQSDVTI